MEWVQVGRLLRTMLYKQVVGELVVKVHNRQGKSLELKPYKQRLKEHATHLVYGGNLQ